MPRITSIIPKGNFTVYVAERQRRIFVVSLSYLNDPAFQDLFNLSCQNVNSSIEIFQMSSIENQNSIPNLSLAFTNTKIFKSTL